MVKTVQNDVAKNITPSDYAKLYFRDKTEKEPPKVESVFQEDVLWNKKFISSEPPEETQQFFDDKKTFDNKLSGALGGAFLSFISLSTLVTIAGGFIFNKLPEHIFDKSLKPLAIGVYVLSALAGFLAYNSANKYNKNLDNLNNIYSLSNKQEQQKADKEIQEIAKANTGKGFIDFIGTISSNNKMEDLISRLSIKRLQEQNSFVANNK